MIQNSETLSEEKWTIWGAVLDKFWKLRADSEIAFKRCGFKGLEHENCGNNVVLSWTCLKSGELLFILNVN